MYADAYTLYHFKDGKTMMWCDYWEKLADYFQNDSVQIFLRYHAYLDDNMIKVVVNIKNNVFLGMMTGNTIGVNQIIKEKMDTNILMPFLYLIILIVLIEQHLFS